MRLLYRRCAGLDIHKDSISACIRVRVNGKAEAEILEERFGAFVGQEDLHEVLHQHDQARFLAEGLVDRRQRTGGLRGERRQESGCYKRYKATMHHRELP